MRWALLFWWRRQGDGPRSTNLSGTNLDSRRLALSAAKGESQDGTNTQRLERFWTAAGWPLAQRGVSPRMGRTIPALDRLSMSNDLGTNTISSGTKLDSRRLAPRAARGESQDGTNTQRLKRFWTATETLFDHFHHAQNRTAPLPSGQRRPIAVGRLGGVTDRRAATWAGYANVCDRAAPHDKARTTGYE